MPVDSTSDHCYLIASLMLGSCSFQQLEPLLDLEKCEKLRIPLKKRKLRKKKYKKLSRMFLTVFVGSSMDLTHAHDSIVQGLTVSVLPSL